MIAPTASAHGDVCVGPRRLAAPFAALALLAFAFRAVGLARLPLDPPEAAIALAAWTGKGLAGAPLHLSLLALVGPALAGFVGADAAARAPSAVAGAIAVALCGGLRRQLGVGGALVAAVAIGFAPWWLAAGRDVDAAPIGLAVALGAAVALASGRVVLASGLAGVGFAAGMVAETALLAAVVVGGGRFIAERRAGREIWAHSAWPTSGRVAASVAAAVLGLGFATVVPWLMSGGVAGWSHFALTGTGGIWPSAPFDGRATGALLIIYAPMITAFGVVGIGVGLARRQPLAAWLAAWLALAALAATRADSTTAATVMFAPLTLAAARTIAEAVSALRQRGAPSREGAVGAMALVCLAYALVRYLHFAERGAPGNVDPVDSLALARYGLTVAVVPIVAAALLWGRDTAARTVALVAFVALGAAGTANGARLLRGRELELARPARTTAGARLLAAEARAGDVAVVADPAVEPALVWALLASGVPMAKGPDGSPVGAAPPRVVPAEADAPGAWRTVTRWRPNFADQQAFARWYLQRRAATPGGAGTVDATWARLEGETP